MTGSLTAVTILCSCTVNHLRLIFADARKTMNPISREPGPNLDARAFFADSFGLDLVSLQKLINEALAKGGDYCDVFAERSQGNWIVMEDGKVNRAYTSVNLGLGIRVLKGERTGYAFSQDLDLKSLLETARAASTLALGPGKAPRPGQKGLEIKAKGNSRDLYPLETPWEQVGLDTRMELLGRVERRMAGADTAILKTLLQFHDSSTMVLFANSEGLLRWDFKPRTGLYASCVAQRNKRRESNYADLSSRAGLELYPVDALDGLADLAVRRTLELFEAGPAPMGESPVVLAAGSAGILLHEAIGHGLEADFNRRGVSTYADRMGRMVAGPEVTVVDDGTIPFAHGAINFDDEGADSKRNVLVEKGRLVSYLHDRLSAKWYGCQSTGSGRRESYQSSPMPRMTCTFMENGPHKPEEVIAGVKKGVYCEQFTNGQVNIGAGDFSFYVKSGRAIENGKLTHPIKDVNITGNGPEALSRIAMVADDLTLAQGGFMCGKNGQTVPVSQGLPTTLVSSLNVGGAGNSGGGK